MMKKALIAMVLYSPCGGLWSLLSHLIGGGTAETFLYPIYGGIILLAGLIVGCTTLILEEIKSLKEEIKNAERDFSKTT